MNLTGQKNCHHWNWKGLTSLKKRFTETKNNTHGSHIDYLNFNVTTANTTDKIVTTQNLTAILLSWYPSF